jgi:hypothetical protein
MRNPVGKDAGMPAFRPANSAQDGRLLGDVVLPVCEKRGRDSGILVAETQV